MPTVRIGTRRDDGGVVAVLEIATAGSIQQRRYGGEDPSGGALLDRLQLRARLGFTSCAVELIGIDVALQTGGDGPGISALTVIPSRCQRRFAATANRTFAGLDWP